MKRTWKVSLPNATMHFEKKEEAKVVRDTFNERHEINYANVSKGPDHPRLNDKGNPTTHTNGGNKGDGFRKPASQRRRERANKK